MLRNRVRRRRAARVVGARFLAQQRPAPPPLPHQQQALHHHRSPRITPLTPRQQQVPGLVARAEDERALVVVAMANLSSFNRHSFLLLQRRSTTAVTSALPPPAGSGGGVFLLHLLPYRFRVRLLLRSCWNLSNDTTPRRDDHHHYYRLIVKINIVRAPPLPSCTFYYYLKTAAFCPDGGGPAPQRGSC